MGRRLEGKALIVVALLVVGSLGDDSGCKRGCSKSDSGLLKFIPGNVYDYNFESVMSLSVVSGSSNDDNTLKVTGSAKLFAEGDCGFTLQIGGVKIISNKENIEKKISNSISKPIHFTMTNGKVHPELCSDANENINTLNIKRALISLIQSTTESEHEIDVFGQCPTLTSSSNVNGATIITKVRNLNKCLYRENIATAIFNGVLNINAAKQSTPIIQADFTKESKILNGILENAKSIEVYKYDDTLNENTGISAKVVTSLKVKNRSGTKVDAPPSGQNKVSLIFEKPSIQASKNIIALKKALEEVVSLTNGFIQQKSASSFVELIRLMRNSDDDSLLELSNVPHQNKVQARKVYLDALFRTGTAESAKATIKQINKLNDEEKRLAILSLNFIQNPDKETLSFALDLLSLDAPKEVFLSVAHLVSKYCHYAKKCDGKEIDAISKKFVESLNHCKPGSKTAEDRIVYVLKGVRKSKEIASKIIPLLNECSDIGRSIRVRVAAIQAFSAVSCETAIKTKALALLGDRNEDSELRIESYLTLIECPSADLANSLSDIINSETVNQVGGFITTNLASIRDSTDRHREAQKHYLSNIRIIKKFPKDFRRYSFNNELSYNLEALQLSASSDYQLIYSQHGFLPRSAKLNITTELFGNNFNLLEGSIRQENLEHLLEYFIGPQGLLNKDFNEILKTIDSSNENSDSRHKRSIADEVNKISKKYKSYGSKSFEDLNLDLSLKLFGSELFFLSLGDNIPASVEEIIIKLRDIFDKSKKDISSLNKDFIVHNFLLDIEIMYPTGAGIPFEFSTQAFSASKIDLGLQLNIESLMEENWAASNFELKCVPSFDIFASMKAGFNALALSTGLKMSSSLQSAFGSDVKLSLLKDGNGFNFDINLPRNKIDLINVGVDVEFYIEEQDKAYKPIDVKTKSKNAADKTSMDFNQLEFLGLKFHFESKNQLLDESLISPFSYSLQMTSELNINIKGSHIEKTEQGSQKWLLEYSTPQSENKHNTNLLIELNGSSFPAFGRIALECDHFHYAFEVGMVNDKKELALYGQFEQDKSVQKSKIGFLKQGKEYTPVIEINENQKIIDNINGYRLDGKIILKGSTDIADKYEFKNLRLFNNDGSNTPIILNGWASIGKLYLNSEVEIEALGEKYKIVNGFKIASSQYDFSLFVNDQKNKDSVLGGSAHIEINQEKISADFTAKGMKWEVNSLSNVEFSLDDSKVLNTISIKNDFGLKHGEEKVLEFLINGSKDDHSLNLKTEIHRSKDFAALNIDFVSNKKSEYDYMLKINGKANKHSFDLMSKLEFNGNHFLLDNTLTCSGGTSISLKGEIGQRFGLQDIFIDMQGSMQLTTKSKPNQLVIKIIGAPEKTSGDFKILQDNKETIKLQAETLHPQDKITSAKISLNVKNVVTGKADFKVARNGKGEFSSVLDFLQSGSKEKIDISSKFHIQAPKYDLELTIQCNENQKFSLKSENSFEKNKYTIKNLMSVNNKNLQLDGNLLLKGDPKFNGETTGNLKLVFPDGKHSVDVLVKRKIITNQKTGLTQGNIAIQINENITTDKKRSLDINSKLEKLNLKTKDFSSSTQVVYTNLDQKKVQIETHLKKQPKSNNKFVEFGFSINGDLIDKPSQININIDEYDANHGIGHLNAQYAGFVKSSFDFEYANSLEEKLFSYKVKGNIDAPKTNWKTFEINSNGKVGKVSTSSSNDDIYDIDMNLAEKMGNGHFGKFKCLFRGSYLSAKTTFELETNDLQEPFKFEHSFEKKSKESSDGKHTLLIKFNEKYLKNSIELTGSRGGDRHGSKEGAESLHLNIILDSSFKTLSNIQLDVGVMQESDDKTEVTIDFQNNDNLKYSIFSQNFHGNNKNGFNLNVNLPNYDPITIYIVSENFGNRKGKLTTEISNLIDLDFKAEAEASYMAINNFNIIAKWTSKKLNLDNYEFDVQSEKNAVQINLKNINGIIFNGSTKITLKEENNKTIIDGQGQLQYKGKSQTSTFRLIKQTFDLTKDREVGFSYNFNGNFGNKNAVSTYKLTNKELNIKFSLCEEKKQCTNVQLQSIVERNEKDFSEVVHSVLILLDLRELGYPYEFDFQSKTINHRLNFQYNLESSIISNNNLKYQLVANSASSGSTVQIKLPKREIILETVSQMPPGGKIFGKYENSIKFYIDKTNRPSDVLSLSSQLDVTAEKSLFFNAKGLLKIEHPSIRPMTINGQLKADKTKKAIRSNLEIDVFQKAEQKILIETEIQDIADNNGFNITSSNKIFSTGLNLYLVIEGHTSFDLANKQYSNAIRFATKDKDAINIYAFGNKNKIEASFYLMNAQLAQINGEINPQKRSCKFKSHISLFDKKSLEVEGLFELYSSQISVQIADYVSFKSDIKLGKALNMIVMENDKTIIEATVSLDNADFLKSDFKGTEEDLKTLLKSIETKLETDLQVSKENIKEKFESLQQIYEKQKDVSLQVLPDLQTFSDNYEKNINQILIELEEDPSFKQISEAFKNLFNSLMKHFNDFSHLSKDLIEKLKTSLESIWKNISEMFKGTILPSLEQLTVHVTEFLQKVNSTLFNILTISFQALMDTLEKYGPTLAKYGQILNDSLKPVKDLGSSLFKFLNSLVNQAEEDLHKLFESLPSFDTIEANLKDKIASLKLAEKALEFTETVFDKLSLLPVNPETNDFLEKLKVYIIAKLKGQPINDDEYAKDIMNYFIIALRSILSSIEVVLPNITNVSVKQNIKSIVSDVFPVFDLLNGLPRLLSFRFSLFNYILNENWQSLLTDTEIFNSWILFKNFELKGLIADGKHIFTFDGKYITFVGTCKYVLAQDSVDNNFTVVANINNGKMKSITLTDRNSNYIEFSESGVLKVNNNVVEFPYHSNGLHSWRGYYTAWMLSEYGVTVMCTNDLKVCHVKVSGFYTGKIRGLFGNGNAEQYDDFLQIDGKISTDVETFINNYAIGKCSPITSTTKEQKSSEICNEIFGYSSPLALSYYFVDFKNFRAACEQSVSNVNEKDDEMNACTIALAYGSSLKLENKFAWLPNRCLKCNGAVNQRDLGQEFTVKVPNNKADVVFVVDLGVNGNILNNLVAQVKKELGETLKSRGFTDVQFGFIAYTENQKYPAILTSDGGKLNYGGNIGDVKLNGPLRFTFDDLLNISHDKKIQEVLVHIQQLFKEIIPQSDEAAYRLALEYPFRAAAAKTIIAIRSDVLGSKNLFKLIRTELVGTITNFDSTLLHLIGPVNGLSVDGVAPEKLIGFNSRLIATLDGKDNKKRSKLQFENNLGIDFVLNNNGWVFNTNNFDKIRSQDQKKVIGQITNSIADSIFKTEITAECTCVPVHGLHAQHFCSTKSSTFVPNKKPKSA